jgi:hypothetical protein
MPLPEQPTPHYLKDSLDLVIENTAAKGGPITDSDLNRVQVAAQVQAGIDKYRALAAGKSPEDLMAEEHVSSRLAYHLVEAYGSRPARCHAHAIVAGKHELAARLRFMMAKMKIGIDDVVNGCWLPENTAATPHPAMPKAPPHSRIHRYNYYFWINSRLRPANKPVKFKYVLGQISDMMQFGGMPDYVLLKKGIGIPKGSNLK